jgi:hypothetical protein
MSLSVLGVILALCLASPAPASSAAVGQPAHRTSATVVHSGEVITGVVRVAPVVLGHRSHRDRPDTPRH